MGGDGDEMDGKAFDFGGSLASWEMDLFGVEGGTFERAFGMGFLYYRRLFKDFLFDTMPVFPCCKLNRMDM